MNKQLILELIDELIHYHPENGDSRIWYETCLIAIKQEVEKCQAM